jgi:hypothetical protein
VDSVAVPSYFGHQPAVAVVARLAEPIAFRTRSREEEGRARAHPPARSGRSCRRVDPGLLPRQAGGQAAPQGRTSGTATVSAARWCRHSIELARSVCATGGDCHGAREVARTPAPVSGSVIRLRAAPSLGEGGLALGKPIGVVEEGAVIERRAATPCGSLEPGADDLRPLDQSLQLWQLALRDLS